MIPIAPSAVAVLAAGLTGWDISGIIGSIIGTIVAVTALILSFSINLRNRRTEYNNEIQEAEKRGASSVTMEVERLKDRITQLNQDITNIRNDRDYWRDLALGGRGKKDG